MTKAKLQEKYDNLRREIIRLANDYMDRALEAKEDIEILNSGAAKAEARSFYINATSFAEKLSDILTKY